MQHLPALLVLVVAVGSPLPTQQSAMAVPSSGTPISGRERGLARVDGELWAIGATYKARFERGAVTIVPPLGVDAPRSLPLRLALDSISIGAERVCEADGASEPIQGEFAVSYRHGADVFEHYAVRTEALEQSFTLRTLPDERGELVLRLRIETELAPRADGAGIYFEGAPGRGLRYGALTAIDARGRRAHGEVRLASGALELVVSADFIATAKAPLLLDPTIGGAFSVHPGPGEVGDPDVTTGVVSGRHFAVYERRFSATDSDIYGQEFQSNGTFIGPTVIYEPSFTPVSQNPTVAVDTLDPPPFGAGVEAYVAVWQQGTSPTASQSVVARASIPTTGVLTPSVTLGGGPGTHTNPDAAGVSFFGITLQSKVVVVWQVGTEIRARYLSVNSTSAAPVLGSTLNLSTSLLDERPVVASHGNHTALVVWTRFFSTPAPGDHDLVGALLSNSGESFAIPTVSVQTTIGPDEQHPRVGNGQIAYARKASSSSSDRDILRAAYDPNDTVAPLPVSAPLTVASGSTSDDHDPALGGSVVGMFLAWIHDAAGELGNYANGVTLLNQNCSAPIFCTPDFQVCESAYSVAFSFLGPGFVDLEIGGAMAVYESVGFGVFAQPLALPSDSSGVPLGGGCAGGGVAGKQCCAAINCNLQHQLTGASPSQPAFLVLGLERIDAGCGSCTLIPDPFSGFVIAAGSTSATGEAKVPMTIPNSTALQGLTFIDQWVVVPGASPCPELGVTLSDARQFTIQ